MTGDHHSQATGVATLLVRAVDVVLGTHSPNRNYRVRIGQIRYLLAADGGTPTRGGYRRRVTAGQLPAMLPEPTPSVALLVSVST
jgi:hypothetical protein